MAKRRRKSSTTKIIRVPSARSASPIIRVQAPRAPTRHKRRRSGRRRSRSLIGGGGYSEPIGLAAGGLAFGFAVKQGWIAKLPEVPIIGRTGLAAILLHEAKKRGMGGEIVRRAATAAAVLTGYQLGLDGKITGEDDAYEGYSYQPGYGDPDGEDDDHDIEGDDEDAGTDFDDESDLDDDNM